MDARVEKIEEIKKRDGSDGTEKGMVLEMDITRRVERIKVSSSLPVQKSV
jgi:hypothetical protein